MRCLFSLFPSCHLLGIVNGQWRSVIALFDMLTYIVAIYFRTPQDFCFLSTLSAVSVGAAATMFTIAEGPCRKNTIEYSRIPDILSQNNVS